METISQTLCLLFTPALCRLDQWDTLRSALHGGVELVQWRVKAPDREGAQRCKELCDEFSVPLIINDQVGLAVDIDAAGAHVGQNDLDAVSARDRLGQHRWLGVSTHDLTQVQSAIEAGADYLGFGPIYPTSTKGYQQGQPTGALAAVIEAASVPVFAIGGIGPANVADVVAAGARHVAVCAAILNAAQPDAAAAALRKALNQR